jgi:DNA-binding MarR family transcriptional regulator
MTPPSLSDPGDRQESPAVKLALGLFRIGQALSHARGLAAAGQGVSPLQLQVLIDLCQEAGGAASAVELARRHGIAAPSMSDSLAGLARRRLIARRACEEDARRRVLTLTPKGRALAQRALDELDRLVGVCADMPRDQRDQALATAVDLIARFNELGWIRADRMCTTCRSFERGHAPGSNGPHYCRLIERPLVAADLRVDCPEHQPQPVPIQP